MNCYWNQRQIAQITLISQLSIPVIQFYCSIVSDQCFLTTHMINFHRLGELMNLALQGLKIYLFIVLVYAYTTIERLSLDHFAGQYICCL